MGRSDACVLCRTPISYSVPEFDGYRTCRTCDVTWCLLEDPFNPADEWEKNYYGRSEILALHEARKSGMEAISARLSAVSNQRGRLLDVGTGLGILMQAAAKDGWLVEGVEPTKIAAEWARKLTGATVYNGLLEELKLPEASYDAVTVLDLLRSIPDPIRFLDSAQRLLRPGGILLIRESYNLAVQRYRRLMRSSAKGVQRDSTRRAVDSAQCFSPKSLLYALQAVGLEGWVEPSPLFVEPAPGTGLITSLLKRAIGLASASAYQASGRRIIISPNLLAFGRAPAA
jgi:2-polyprenyl-3-methyl-5-hydroxy-6-metoxy-1,4-benzoquinol methylase